MVRTFLIHPFLDGDNVELSTYMNRSWLFEFLKLSELQCSSYLGAGLGLQGGIFFLLLLFRLSHTSFLSPHTTIIGVSIWIERRKIDLFSRKSVIFPRNLDSHWSMCAIVDLYNFAIAGYHQNTTKWLITEWKNITVDSDRTNEITSYSIWYCTSITDLILAWFKVKLLFKYLMSVISILKQKNGFDSDVYVCCFALALYKLWDQAFMYQVLCRFKSPLVEKVKNNVLFKYINSWLMNLWYKGAFWLINYPKSINMEFYLITHKINLQPRLERRK